LTGFYEDHDTQGDKALINKYFYSASAPAGTVRTSNSLRQKAAPIGSNFLSFILSSCQTRAAQGGGGLSGHGVDDRPHLRVLDRLLNADFHQLLGELHLGVLAVLEHGAHCVDRARYVGAY